MHASRPMMFATPLRTWWWSNEFVECASSCRQGNCALNFVAHFEEQQMSAKSNERDLQSKRGTAWDSVLFLEKSSTKYAVTVFPLPARFPQSAIP